MPESEIKEKSPEEKGRESESKISDSGCDLEISGPGLPSMTWFKAVKGDGGEHECSSRSHSEPIMTVD